MKNISLCEGSCEEHSGNIRSVHVTGQNGHDWGVFMYCEEAINEDQRRGLSVEVVNAGIQLFDSAAASDEK